MNISDALKELGDQIGLPELDLDEHGIASLIFNEDLVVTMQSTHGGNTLALSTAIGDVTVESADEDLMKLALQASLLGGATDGAHFSFDPADGQLKLEHLLPMATLSFTEFLASVESFVSQAQMWQTKFDAAME